VLAVASFLLYLGVSLSSAKGRATLEPVFRPKVSAER